MIVLIRVAYQRILAILANLWSFAVSVARRSDFARITVDFLTEVAVLVMVFPTLDTIIEKGQSKVTRGLVIWSVAIALICLFMAGIISMFGKEE